MSIITVSRMYGSGGSEVAARVAKALGWSLFDNAVIDAVAEMSGLSHAEVAARDERVPSMVERLSTALSLGSPEMMPPVPDHPIPTTDERVVDVTRRVIEDAVRTGPAVFVGRGAQCLLAERTDALHVFCYAPKSYLVDYAVRQHALSRPDAEKRVAQENREREQYVRRHWQRNWLAFENYHLCVNTAWLGIDGAAEVVIGIASKRFALEG